MIKRIISLFVVIMVCVFSFITVYAQSSYVVDEPKLLSNEQRETLNDKCIEIKDNTGISVYVLVLNTINYKRVETFAEEYHKENNLDNDCVMLLISMDSRDMDICAHGKGEDALDASRREEIFTSMYDYMHYGNYNDAFNVFISGVIKFSKPYVSFSWVIISIVIGMGISLIITLVLKSKHKSVKFQRDASAYVKNGSLNLTNQSDQFLYFTINRIKKPTNDNNNSFGGMHSSGGGGGSFGHTSGKF